MNNFEKWLDTKDSVSRRLFVLFGAGMFIVGLIFAMAFLVPESTTEYRYVEYCDEGSSPTSGEVQEYTVGEAIEEFQTIELPLFVWGLLLLALVLK